VVEFFTGVGSRRGISNEILNLLGICTRKLTEENGLVLFTGDAEGVDKVCWKNAHKSYRVGFSSSDAQPWAFDEIRRHMPNDRGSFDTFTSYVQGLLARNMMQVLGENGDERSKFVLCWAPSLFYADSSAGGTGYAIRCALYHSIPVFNLKDPRWLDVWTKFAQSELTLDEVLAT